MTATVKLVESYHDTLRKLSEASVRQHFEAFVDIDWDSYEIRDDDERWILPASDNLGRHPWYQGLPKKEQIRVGRYRMALACKVGLQFEQLLLAGMAAHLGYLPNGNPEFRYATHEMTEETHHTQMFQEFVNRVSPDVHGAPHWMRALFPVATVLMPVLPAAFYIAILAGEEPIDYGQKIYLRDGGTHPLMDRVMQIHVAEEARHISFAHKYLEQNVPGMDPVRKAALSAFTPLVMRVLGDVIMKPTMTDRKAMGIPMSVYREVWWKDEQRMLSDLYTDVRMLFDDLGLRKGPAKLLWKLFKIDGRSARYRSEPVRSALS